MVQYAPDNNSLVAADPPAKIVEAYVKEKSRGDDFERRMNFVPLAAESCAPLLALFAGNKR